MGLFFLIYYILCGILPPFLQLMQTELTFRSPVNHILDMISSSLLLTNVGPPQCKNYQEEKRTQVTAFQSLPATFPV